MPELPTLPNNTSESREGYPEKPCVEIVSEYTSLFPPAFFENPYSLLQNSETSVKLISRGSSEKYPDEEILLITLPSGHKVIAKRFEYRKTKSHKAGNAVGSVPDFSSFFKEARKEYLVMKKAKELGLPTANPIAFVFGRNFNEGSYVIMEFIEGVSGDKFEEEMQKFGFSEEVKHSLRGDLQKMHREIAQNYRERIGIDKNWYLKDLIIQLDQKEQRIVRVVPVDWERISRYNPTNPKTINS